MRDSQEIFREAEAYHVERLERVNAKLLEALEQLLEERFTPQAGHNEYKLHSMLSETQNLARAAIKAARKS